MKIVLVKGRHSAKCILINRKSCMAHSDHTAFSK
jgi:hypothetical protein